MADARRYGLTPQLDIQQILSEAPLRWLRPAEICEILRNHRQFRIETEPPNRPPSGSLFLFDRKVLRYFRKDGHNWRKKKDGKTVKEAHERLKSGSIDVLHCYYAHGEENSNFQRRSYWMLEEHLMHIVLVHYREVKDKKETYCRTRDTEELGQGSYVDSPVGSCSITNYPQMTSPVTDIDSQNNTQISEFEDTESADKSHAISRHNPFPEVPNFDGQSLINPQVGIYIQPQIIHSDQHIKRKVTQADIARLLGETSTGFTTFNGSGTQLDLSSWETDPASWSSGNRNPDFLASSTLSFDIDHQSNGLPPADGFSDSVHVTLEDNLWQDALKSDSALPVNEVSPMFAALLKQLSLDLPNTDGNKGIQKNDSFSRWASKELDEVVDGLNPNSGIHWDEVRNATMSEGSCLSPDDHQTYAMSPSLSKDQLFSISDIYPSWSYAGAEIMVFVSGSFLVSTDDILKHKWSCMFGQEEVPAEVVANGVLRCLSPASRSAQVPFYVTCSNRFACSEVREFEFHPYNEKDLEIYDPYTLATNEMVIYTHLDRILSTGSPLHQDTMYDFSSEKINMCNKVSSLMMGTNDELCLVLKKASDNDTGFAENPNDQLMQSLLKQKLHLWLINKVLEGGKGPCTLDQHGFGVIHLAAALGYNWVIAPLIAAGLNINFRDARGWTALHWAASYGRESTIVALLSLGANSGALTDPTPVYPSGRMAAELASDNGHKGIAGFLAESSLTTHLSSLNLKESRGNGTTSIPNLPTSVFAEDSGSIHVEGDLQAHLSLKDSLSAVRNAAQAAARIHQVYRVQSFHRKKVDEYKEDKVGISDERSLSRISAKPNRASQNDEPAYAAAVKIQKKFRGWKKRKAFLIIRQHVVKIQAHVRGYQVRKHFRKIVWSVGIVEKAILRWRRKGSGLRGFRSSGLPEGTSMQVLPVKEDDYDFLREGRKQTEQRLERALAKVKSMVQYPEARDQYRRLLTGIEEFQGSKVILERFLYDDEEIVDTNMMFVDIDELLEDETVM